MSVIRVKNKGVTEVRRMEDKIGQHPIFLKKGLNDDKTIILGFAIIKA
jgi:hypothetical protein